MAVSADGSTAAICGPTIYDKSILVFVLNNGIWVQQGGQLLGNGIMTGGYLGSSLAISADGNTLVEGDPNDENGTGALWVFNRDVNDAWTQSAKLVASDLAVAADFGFSVAVSADGHTIVAGAPADQTNGDGAAWVFAQDGSGNWTQQGNKLLGAGTGITFKQGLAVAISADGSTITIAGRFVISSTSSLAEAAWVFVRQSDESWVQQGDRLTGTDMGVYANFVTLSLALSADGNTAVEGINYKDVIPGVGCWVYVRDGSGHWALQGPKINEPNAAFGTSFGYSVSLSADGNTMVTGGPSDSLSAGACWVFTRDAGGTWAQKGSKLKGTDAVWPSAQGSSVAISADGNTMIEGGYQDDNVKGAAWVFVDSSQTSLPVTLTNFTAYPQGKGVQTAWTGYNEINMASYDVERSANGYLFNKIGNVAAKDNNASENSYTLFDASPLDGDNYYRIKAISKDGTVQYSRIAKVVIGSTLSSIQVYPNPVSNKTIQVQLNNVDAGTYAITVYNQAGQKVYYSSYVHAGGYATVPVLINGIASGIYHVEVKGTNKSLSIKVVVQ